jgi:hypothetical protein
MILRLNFRYASSETINQSHHYRWNKIHILCQYFFNRLLKE